MYASPVDVPDMPRADEGVEPARKGSEGLHPAFAVAVVVFIVIAFVLPALGPIIGAVARIIFLVLLAGVIGLTITKVDIASDETC